MNLVGGKFMPNVCSIEVRFLLLLYPAEKKTILLGV